MFVRPEEDQQQADELEDREQQVRRRTAAPNSLSEMKPKATQPAMPASVLTISNVPASTSE